MVGADGAGGGTVTERRRTRFERRIAQMAQTEAQAQLLAERIYKAQAQRNCEYLWVDDTQEQAAFVGAVFSVN